MIIEASNPSISSFKPSIGDGGMAMGWSWSQEDIDEFLSDPNVLEEMAAGGTDPYDFSTAGFVDPFEEDELALEASKAASIHPSAFIRMSFKMPRGDGTYENFSFDGRRHMERLYDTPARRLLFKTSRQSEKSTTLGNIGITYAALVPGFQFLYVSPSSLQTKTFSSDRIKEPLETSNVLKAFTTSALIKNVFEMQFLNRSKIRLRYAYLTADRARGVAAWQLAMDEVQDVISDNIPVIEQCLSHAPKQWKRFIYAGTPKTFENNIETLWGKSTQGEWAVPCDHCGSNAKGAAGRFWNILGEKNIGKTGPICARCGGGLHPGREESQWAHMTALSRSAPWEGYRINQLMVPWLDWEHDILYAYENWPRSRFFNEVLGLSYDEGFRPITMGQLISACNPRISMTGSALRNYLAGRSDFPIVMGIDWSGGDHSYTVITLSTYIDGKFQIFYIKRCTGELFDPEMQIKFIKGLVRRFNVVVIGSDEGGGFYGNKMLYKAYGPNKLVTFQYVQKAKKKVWWNPLLRRFIVMRSEIMSDVFTALKVGQIMLPRWEEFHSDGQAPYATDFLNIYTHYNRTTFKLIFDHKVDRPDDSFHSCVYNLLASMLLKPRPEIVMPLKDTDSLAKGLFGYDGPIEQMY